ncbi:E3 ubiquitin ligase BIG BROTHER-related [Eucalyptus grandis]|uniref:E3 ubiquitin ligase BIG BROTHER-related n=1 Tax=Eucalyptus grandis TaxID=71139 RepID=UPI00192EB959|nr:E3 ubiquitin ligase BIG BROTHER-related [Eucalyptus grandis]
MDNEEESKRNSRSRPATPPAGMNDDQGPDPHPALAMSSRREEEEQEAREDRDRTATLSTIASETEEEDEASEEEEEDDESSDDGGEDQGEDRYDYFSGLGFEAEFGFLEGEDSSQNDIDMAEFDDIDPDELSYEELIELGEIIGEERRGLSLEQIGKCFGPFTFQSQSAVERKMGAIDRCVICQIEYEEGEKLVILDSCDHSYHSECITQWLQVKKTCPICSTEVSAPKKSMT